MINGPERFDTVERLLKRDHSLVNVAVELGSLLCVPVVAALLAWKAYSIPVMVCIIAIVVFCHCNSVGTPCSDHQVSQGVLKETATCAAVLGVFQPSFRPCCKANYQTTV